MDTQNAPNSFHTPKLPSAPSFSVKKTSPRVGLRLRINDLKHEITQTENRIASMEVEVQNLKTKKIEYQVMASHSDDSFQLGFAISISQEVIPKIKLLVEKQKTLNLLYGSLSEAQKELMRADEEAAKRARASTKAMLCPAILSNEGPDIAYVANDAKFRQIQTWLHQERVLLLRSPPGTGKTTFARAFFHYLTDNCFGATYLNASVPENMPNATRSMDDIWQEAFESEMTFSAMSKSSHPNDLHYVIIDESQSWYPYNTGNTAAEREVKAFWAAVKLYVQPALPFTNYPDAPSESMSSEDLPPTGIRLLCLAGYGETNVGSIATPLRFQDPEDPATGCRLPLGLNFLRLDREFTSNLVEKFIEIKAIQGKKTTFDSEVYDLIYEETNGHVGAIRALLHHLVSSDRRSKQHVLDFVHRDVYQVDMNPFRAFFSISQAVIGRLSVKDLILLIKCIVHFKKGFHEFEVTQLQVVELVKLGIFIKIAATGVNEKIRVAFPSPLHFDLLLHNFLHRPLELHQSRDCFEGLLKELVLRMSPKVLQDTVANDNLETHWKSEVWRSFQTISDRVLRTSREFNQQAFLDLYVDDGLQWGIELIRDGNGEQLEEHVGRFRPDGRYCDIPMQEYAILNFTRHRPSAATLHQYHDENVYHLVYNKTYTEVTVYRKGRVVEDWNLIGFQGRTEC